MLLLLMLRFVQVLSLHVCPMPRLHNAAASLHAQADDPPEAQGEFPSQSARRLPCFQTLSAAYVRTGIT